MVDICTPIITHLLLHTHLPYPNRLSLIASTSVTAFVATAYEFTRDTSFPSAVLFSAVNRISHSPMSAIVCTWEVRSSVHTQYQHIYASRQPHCFHRHRRALADNTNLFCRHDYALFCTRVYLSGNEPPGPVVISVLFISNKCSKSVAEYFRSYDLDS
jgi:hypothetical protein